MSKKHKKILHFRFIHIISVAVILLIFVGVSFFAGQVLLKSSAVSATARTIPHLPEKAVCGLPGVGRAKCHAHVVTNNQGLPQAGSMPAGTSYGPVQFHLGYNLPCTPGGNVDAVCATPSAGFGPQTIAIIDAYHTPTIENDLHVYSSYFGLPDCTRANGCLQVLNQNGETSLPTTVDGGWSLEASLDVQVAHSVCQTCKIILFEANSNNFSDLATAVQTAAGMGVTAISNSYGGSEWNGEINYDSYYNHPGIAVTVSAGDGGYGAEFPAASNGVVAIGGTTMQLNTDNSYAAETVWNGTGSGCSSYETANSWQTTLSNWSLTGCGGKRGIVDMAADADPNTGAAVYDSTPYNGSTGWYQVGGTSLSAPLIAGVYALAGGVPANTYASSLPYVYFTPTNAHDVTSGTNGHCTTNMCTAGTGYDGPTGLGTPNGISGFMMVLTSPTTTPTQGPTPTPTPGNVDTTKPTVSITSPLPNSIVKRGSTVTISATASDNVGVTQVVFAVNGATLCSDLGAPYTCNWKVPAARKTYQLTATATDTSGNTAVSTIYVNAR